MKSIIASLFAFISIIASSQSVDQENLEKYWKYRDQLKKRFMKIGIEAGQSIPASVIIPNRQYGQTDQNTGSIIQWRDATITVG